VHVDRRVQRTRRLLGEALIGLIIERGYDGLTIKDVTDRADVAYVTFFRHYRSLNELLSELLNETIQRMTVEIEEAMPGGAAWYTPEGGLRIFTHVGEHAALYRILLTSPGATAVRGRMRSAIAANVMRNCAAQLARSDIPAEIAADHLAASQLALLEWWLVNDRRYPEEQMADIYTRMIVVPTLNVSAEDLAGMGRATHQP
jgi:AcrR family transcriptional regulator